MKEKRLTARQEKVARAIVTGSTATDAVRSAYNVTTADSARTIASRLLNNERVQNRINELLDRAYPNLDAEIAYWLSEGLNAPVGRESGEQSWSDKKSFIQMLLDTRGYGPVKKTASVKAVVKTPLGPLGGAS